MSPVGTFPVMDWQGSPGSLAHFPGDGAGDPRANVS
jgi:hypothetical protein